MKTTVLVPDRGPSTPWHSPGTESLPTTEPQVPNIITKLVLRVSNTIPSNTEHITCITTIIMRRFGDCIIDNALVVTRST